MTMRLKSIKLAGFKSFVDPTTLPINSQLVGVVGPNGCGKSNVIDAVRWVMGGTAKKIRGGIGTDVIFSGSTARKPVSQASVELIFDNSDGKLGGEFAQYNEISIKRGINRDGVSVYYLNQAKCRLKDISDIFMGTGLGPNSYAIIEQGMISRVVESKPEDLRVFIEEAAGISKYKDRRRETETRIRHTRENLDRLNDLREELEKQLQRLHRQAQAAEKFKRLKSEQKQLKLSLSVLILQDIVEELGTLNSGILTHSNQLEAAITDLGTLKTESEKLRVAQHQANDATEQVQKRYYDLGTEIAKNEQQLAHLHEQKQQYEINISESKHALEEKQYQLEEAAQQLETAKEDKSQTEPEYNLAIEELEELQNTLQNLEASLQQTHTDLQKVQQDLLVPTKVAEAEKSTITQLEKQIHEKGQRKDRLSDDLANLASNVQEDIDMLELKIAECDESKSMVETQSEEAQTELATCEEQLKDVQRTLNQKEREHIDNSAQLKALKQVQENALGKSDKTQQLWLENQNLQNNERLVEKLNVNDTWRVAVEVVLADLLTSVVVDSSDLTRIGQSDDIAASLTVWGQGNTLNKTGLLAQIENAELLPQGLARLLANIETETSLLSAIEKSNQSGDQSFITPSGIWVGQGWLKGKSVSESQESVLEREEAIRVLQETCSSLAQMVEQLQNQEEELQEKLHHAKQNVANLTSQLQQYNNDFLNFSNELKLKQNQLQNELQRKEHLQSDIQECTLFIEDAQNEVNKSRTNLSEALDSMEQLTAEQTKVQAKLQEIEQGYVPLKQKAKLKKDQTHELSLTLNNQTNYINNLTNSINQLTQSIESEGQKLSSMQEQLIDMGEPIHEVESNLEQQLQARVEVEKELNEARDSSNAIENQFNENNKTTQQTEEQINHLKDTITEQKMRLERLSVQKENEETNLKNLNITFEQAQEQLIEDLDKEEGLQTLDKIENQINRLGPINLAAIEEFDAAQERKIYLDTQNDDLNEALATLEEAIGKIDHETRQKFKDTFDKVDEGFKTLFPRLFGGGEAKLVLTGEDLLDTGINIIARPPGKRNATIQQLSGGEKALTAVSLVFSIFQLNPAPFCLLDEVDAPLDDNNVGRFCEMVKEMAKTVQFLYISHNKLAIEMAQALHGVTMREAGVSRLVSVDVEKATKMAEADVVEES